jgi:hypothetical protein
MVWTLETFARVGHSVGLNSASRWTPAAALPLYARLPAASPRHRPPTMKRIFLPDRAAEKDPFWQLSVPDATQLSFR